MEAVSEVTIHCLKSHFSRLAVSKCSLIYPWHVCDLSHTFLLLKCCVSECFVVILYHASCLPPPVSCLTTPVSRLLSPVSRLLSHMSCLTSPVSRLTSAINAWMCAEKPKLSAINAWTYAKIPKNCPQWTPESVLNYQNCRRQALEGCKITKPFVINNWSVWKRTKTSLVNDQKKCQELP